MFKRRPLEQFWAGFLTPLQSGASLLSVCQTGNKYDAGPETGLGKSATAVLGGLSAHRVAAVALYRWRVKRRMQYSPAGIASRTPPLPCNFPKARFLVPISRNFLQADFWPRVSLFWPITSESPGYVPYRDGVEALRQEPVRAEVQSGRSILRRRAWERG